MGANLHRETLGVYVGFRKILPRSLRPHSLLWVSVSV